MSKRHLAVLFLCSFAPFVVGSGALPLLVGRWSDRVGRTRFLLVSYLASSAGMVLLALSTSLWHFGVAVTVGIVASSVATAVGPALVADLVPRDALGRGIGLYGTTGMIGAVIGFASTGHAVQRMGMLPTLIASAALPLVSIAVLLPAHRARAVAAAQQHAQLLFGLDHFRYLEGESTLGIEWQPS